jgi:hypothetical protein
MSDAEPRRTYIGTFPAGYGDTFIDGVDPARIMLGDAVRRADEARAAEELRRKAAIADIERAKDTRAARTRRRFARALRAVLCLR